jgi:hypothetical protein
VFTENDVANPCLPNPCKYNGICTIGFEGAFACICLSKNTGILNIT